MPSRLIQMSLTAFVMTLALLVGAKEPVSAACTINVFVQNTGKHRIWIRNEVKGLEGTAVRTPLTGWYAMRNGNWAPAGIPDKEGGPFVGINAGQHLGDGFDTPLSCNLRRRYRIDYVCDSGPSDGSRFVHYFPSVDGWTPREGINNVNIPLGSKCN